MSTHRTPLPMNTDTAPPADPAPETPPPAKALDRPLTDAEIGQLNERIVEVMHTVFDPEIPVNIYELGLIYEIGITPAGAVDIQMTLTSPACPVAGTLPGDVQRKVLPLDGVTACKVDVVWDPPWTKDRMSEAAKLQLGIDD